MKYTFILITVLLLACNNKPKEDPLKFLEDRSIATSVGNLALGSYNISDEELAKANLRTMHNTNINVKDFINETIDKLDAKEQNDGHKLANYQNTSDLIEFLDNPILRRNMNSSFPTSSSSSQPYPYIDTRS